MGIPGFFAHPSKLYEQSDLQDNVPLLYAVKDVQLFPAKSALSQSSLKLALFGA